MSLSFQWGGSEGASRFYFFFNIFYSSLLFSSWRLGELFQATTVISLHSRRWQFYHSTRVEMSKKISSGSSRSFAFTCCRAHRSFPRAAAPRDLCVFQELPLEVNVFGGWSQSLCRSGVGWGGVGWVRGGLAQEHFMADWRGRCCLTLSRTRSRHIIMWVNDVT